MNVTLVLTLVWILVQVSFYAVHLSLFHVFPYVSTSYISPRLLTQLSLERPVSTSASAFVSVSSLSWISLSLIAACCFRYLYHKTNPGNIMARTTTETKRPMAALALELRPAETEVGSEDCGNTKLAVLEAVWKDVGEAAPKIVETATLTTAVLLSFAI